MYRVSSRLLLAAALAVASLAVAVAQERPKDPDDYRRFFRKPENALEFWKAIQFELDVGRPERAAQHRRALLVLMVPIGTSPPTRSCSPSSRRTAWRRC